MITHDYVQPTDPRLDVDKTVVYGDRWWDTSTKIIYVTNADNTGWDAWSGVFGP